jgi:hypothetical protein
LIIKTNIIWEGEPPGEPLFQILLETTGITGSLIKYIMTAQQEVRPPNFGEELDRVELDNEEKTRRAI